LPPDSASRSRHLIVARRDLGAGGPDGSRCLIRLQVFNADGSACGPEVTLDAAAAGNQFHPATAALADGRFALAWQEAIGSDSSCGHVLRIQVFNADGSPWELAPQPA
jgi:hypothetical protein